MGKFYAGLVMTVVLVVGGLFTLIAAKRRGMAAGVAKGRAREIIRDINEAVASGDDAAIQKALEDKAHE